jgi:DNA-binding MarR family transcriptional regulator
VAPSERPSKRSEEDGAGDLGVVDGLVQLSFLVQGVLGRVASNFELSIVQTRLLGVLRDRHLGMLELARILNLEKSSVTGLVDRAERRGLVERTTNPQDGRGVRVTLSPHGHQLARAFVEEIGRQLDVLVEGLDDNDRIQLAALASRIVLGAASAQGLDLRT